MSLLLLVTAIATAARADAITAPQGELALLLGHADTIDRVDACRAEITFTLDRKGETYRVVATTRAAEVIAIAVTDLGRAPHARTAGRFTWLARELAHATAIPTLAVAADGTVTIATRNGARYAIIAGTDGNTAVAARWAATWDDSGDGQ